MSSTQNLDAIHHHLVSELHPFRLSPRFLKAVEVEGLAADCPYIAYVVTVPRVITPSHESLLRQHLVVSRIRIFPQFDSVVSPVCLTSQRKVWLLVT